MTQKITKSIFQSNVILQREEDGYVNATLLCAGENKKFASWHRTQTTKDFIKALAIDVQISTSELVQVKKGGTREEQGTWVHPHVGINLAQWLSPKFATMVSRVIIEWNETKHLTSEEKQFRAIMKHTQVSEQKRNSKNLNWVISNSSKPENFGKVHFKITSAISGKSPTKWKQLGMKKYEKEQEKVRNGEMKLRARLYKKSDIVSGLGVIRIQNKPVASAISLAHNCIAEKNAPLNLGIETGKSSLDLFKNLEKIEKYNSNAHLLEITIFGSGGGTESKIKENKNTKYVFNLAEVKKRLLSN